LAKLLFDRVLNNMHKNSVLCNIILSLHETWVVGWWMLFIPRGKFL